MPGLPAALEGLVVVQVSDTHLGFRASLNRRATRKAFAIARAARPDLIVFTGDLVSGPGGVTAIEAELAGLWAPLGIFAVLGNHDRGFSKAPGVPAADLSGLERVGVRLLTNECVTIPHAAAGAAAGADAGATASADAGAAASADAGAVRGAAGQIGDATLQICGVDEWEHGYADVAAVSAALDRRPGTLRLLLSHYAQAALELEPGDVSVSFSGDTHGGQICLPWFDGRIMLSQPRARFKDGLYEIGGRRMYVTRGIGTSFLPFRFLCRPEVVVFHFTASATGA